MLEDCEMLGSQRSLTYKHAAFTATSISPWRLREMVTYPSWILISTGDLMAPWVIQFSVRLLNTCV
jgi:hypothetical protein